MDNNDFQYSARQKGFHLLRRFTFLDSFNILRFIYKEMFLKSSENRGIRSIRLKKYPVYIGGGVLGIIPEMLAQESFSNIVVLTDSNTRKHCLPVLEKYLKHFKVLEIPPGESSKSLERAVWLWQEFTRIGLDRGSVVINLGGGVVTDLGGFAEATFKRGIEFWHVPTSLMGMVDASIGGKTGIDFLNLKNQVGLYRDPAAIFVYPPFLKTLSEREIQSGFAEVIKHGLVRDYSLWERVHDAESDGKLCATEEIIGASIWVKADLVQMDPYERKLRKALNFGHSIGHALESVFLEKESADILLHGEAIAIGMICESFISFQKRLLDEDSLNEITFFLLRHFPAVTVSPEDEKKLLQLLPHDKKNVGNKNMFTLLNGIGSYLVNQEVTQEEVIASLSFYREMISRQQPL